jgi:hypothetical protein
MVMMGHTALYFPEDNRDYEYTIYVKYLEMIA